MHDNLYEHDRKTNTDILQWLKRAATKIYITTRITFIKVCDEAADVNDRKLDGMVRIEIYIHKRYNPMIFTMLIGGNYCIVLCNIKTFFLKW